MKINITRLGLRKKSAEVKTTVGVVEKAQNLQIQLLKSDSIDFTNDDPLAVLETQKKMVQGLVQFMIDILSYPTKKLKRLNPLWILRIFKISWPMYYLDFKE